MPTTSAHFSCTGPGRTGAALASGAGPSVAVMPRDEGVESSSGFSP